MGIRFDCISCGKKLIVHDRFHGRQIKCPACEIQLKVPSRSESSTTTSLSENSKFDESSQPHRIGNPSERGIQETTQRMPLPSESDRNNPTDLQSQDATNSSLPTEKSQGEEELGSEFSETVAADLPRNSNRRERPHKEEEDVEWDITPMVDVAFLLLIFFMLTASFSIQKAIPTSAEQQDKPSSNSIQRERADRPESFVIQIDEFNAYTVISNDGGTMEASSKQELIVVLKDLKAQLGDVSPRVDIQAHVLSIHGAVVACMDAAREAEFESFQMQSVEEFD